MFESLRSRLAKAIAPRGKRMYAAAKYSRLTADWNPQTGSSDSELWSSLTNLRNRSRQLIRDNAYAKRAKLIVVNNVIGSGIGMEPQVRLANGRLNEAVNDAIEEAYCDWSRPENCHTGGKLAFADLERQAFGQIFEAGEVLIRKHYQKFGNSTVPLGLELVEAERMADDSLIPPNASPLYRLGIDRDEFGRPLTFWLRRYHPGEFRYVATEINQVVGVPADQVFHLYVCDRWPQTRGEPWLHAAMRRLNDMDGYAEAEIVRARTAACRVGIIQTPDESALPNDQEDPNAQPQFDLEPGMVQRLGPGETWVDSDPSSPNMAADPFMRLMLREVAAGVGVSYASMSMDYSQSNYSSSRLALLDDRDLWRVFQQFFIRNFREPLHREWLELAVLARAIPEINVADYVANQKTYEAVAFKPRGWQWIDPSKEVDALLKARRAGFISTSQIAALTGAGDLEDLWTQMAAENADAKAKGLTLTSDAGQILEGRESNPTAAPPQATEQPAADADSDEDAEEQDLAARSVVELRQERAVVQAAENIARIVGASMGQAFAQLRETVRADVREIVATIPASPAPIINIAPQPVHIAAPEIKVDVAAPAITVDAPEPPDVNVHLAPQMNIEVAPRGIDEAEIVERDEARRAKVVRTDRGTFEVIARDDLGDAKVVRRRTA